MNEHETIQRIEDLVHKSTDYLVSIHPESHLENDLGLDSLDRAELGLLVVEEFDLDLPENFYPETIQDLLDEITKPKES